MQFSIERRVIDADGKNKEIRRESTRVDEDLDAKEISRGLLFLMLKSEECFRDSVDRLLLAAATRFTVR